jgi:hypothetical protein
MTPIFVTEMGLVNALRKVHTAQLVLGIPLSEHVSHLHNLWQNANDIGAKVDNSSFYTIFISLLGEEWDAMVPVSHTYETSAEVISFVTMHAERISSHTTPAGSTVLATNTQEPCDARWVVLLGRRNIQPATAAHCILTASGAT